MTKAAPSECQRIFGTEIPTKLRRKPDFGRSGQGVFELRISGKGGGTWAIDLNQSPPVVVDGGDPDADVAVEMSEEDFLAFYAGKLGGFSAFLDNRIRVKGNMHLAMKMGKLLRSLL